MQGERWTAYCLTDRCSRVRSVASFICSRLGLRRRPGAEMAGVSERPASSAGTWHIIGLLCPRAPAALSPQERTIMHNESFAAYEARLEGAIQTGGAISLARRLTVCDVQNSMPAVRRRVPGDFRSRVVGPTKKKSLTSVVHEIAVALLTYFRWQTRGQNRARRVKNANDRDRDRHRHVLNRFLSGSRGSFGGWSWTAPKWHRKFARGATYG